MNCPWCPNSHGPLCVPILMPILYDMARQNKIDMQLVQDIDRVMAPYSGLDIPDVTPEDLVAGAV